ncbi:MAG: flagellar filament capping protein FliD [bacterium]|nr:flagellar filament capping protein FliD [bacterium]
MSTAIEGLISGFNTTDLINAILDIQVRGPISKIESRVKTEQTKLAAFQQLNASVLGLDISSQSFRTGSLFANKKAQSSNESIVSASASSAAQEGAFSLRVDNLAKNDQISSSLFTSADEELGFTGKFVINGRAIDVGSTDTLRTISTQINSSGAGVKAQVVQVAPNQNKLIIAAQDTGANRLELRKIGASNLLDSLGLIDGSTSYDYTVNADNVGALGSKFASTDTFDMTGKSFTVEDAGGQNSLTVNFSGVLTLSQIAQEINDASTTAGSNISASIVNDGTDQRLRITSTTGIPNQFDDPDNALFDLGVVGGIQSEDFASSVTAVGKMLNLGSASDSTFRITNGDGSSFIDVTVNLGTDSLQKIVDKINAAATPPPPGSDISAQVITAGGVSRIEISSASGAPVFSNDADNVLSTLGIVDTGFANYDQKGENSQITFNGVTVNRSSNLVNDLVDGVSLALKEESASTVYVGVNADHSAVSTSVQSFVDAFNQVADFIDEQTVFDPKNGNGVLFGNDVVRQLQSALANAVGTVVPNLPSLKLSQLNDGAGVDLGKIKITDRAGNTAEIDLNDAQTVQDVIDEINYNDTIQVTAEVNSTGDSINLIDTSGGYTQLKVEEVDGTTAADLGLKRQVASNRLTGGVIATGAGSTPLSSLGIELDSTGHLSFDQNKLESALRDNPDLVENVLTASNVGFGSKFRSMLKTFTTINTGLLDTTTKGMTDFIERQIQRIDDIESRAAIQEQTLRKRFSALEVTMSQSQQVSQLLSQRLGGNGG